MPPPIDPDGDGSAPPVRQLYPSANPVRRSSRRGSSIIADIRDILNPRTMREASTQERIAALRVVREHGAEEDARRRRRLTTKLQDVFSVRTLRGRSPVPPTQGGSSSEGTGRRGSAVERGTSVRESVIEVPEAEAEGVTATSPVRELHAAKPVEVSDPIEEVDAEHHQVQEPEASSSTAAEQPSGSKPAESSIPKEAENNPSS
jgi:hypothetical protein